MFKLKEMVTALGLILLAIFIIVSFTGANPHGQVRNPIFMKTDTVSAPMPKIFLEQALMDSLAKLERLKQSNDSVARVRKHKWEKINKLIHHVLNKKEKQDTVYLPTIIDSSFYKDINFLYQNL